MLLQLTDTEFVHVEHLLVENSAQNEVIRSLLLCVPISEQGSIILVANVLQTAEILEGIDIILLVVKVLLTLWVAQSVVRSKNVVDHLTRLVTLQ